ncbi:hypothetical protein C8R46DRAFT_1208056 [Mycena filopes]|nr:hypothetical protein C8R46DRAFT_1208056 [Mycena filopes]
MNIDAAYKTSRSLLIDPTIHGELTTNQADRLLAEEFFERIGRRERQHELAIEEHLKKRTRASFDQVTSTWQALYYIQEQVPPPIVNEGTYFSAKDAIARGRAQANIPTLAEAERAWAYGHTDGEGVERAWASVGYDHACPFSREMGPGQRRDSLEPEGSLSAFVDEAEAALKNVEQLAKSLRARIDDEYEQLDKDREVVD